MVIEARMTSLTATIRVAIAEDHALVREGITRLVREIPNVELVGVAEDGYEAVQLVEMLEPDIILLDITMPRLGGLGALSRIVADHPTTHVIMLSMHDNEEYVAQALKGGARGYLLKDSDVAEIGLAIRAVMRGGSYLTPAVSRQVIRDFTHGQARSDGPFDRLTPRQTEIAQLVAEGHRNAEIAGILGTSIKTVETHRTQLMARLGVHDVAGLVRYAIRVGLVPADK
jgi:DNA-binding NarL/FixJ family response regulator